MSKKKRLPLFFKRPVSHDLAATQAAIGKTRMKCREIVAGLTCLYCGRASGETILAAGAMGIAWGHAECVLQAYRCRRLLLSTNSAMAREARLLEHCLTAEETNERRTAAGWSTSDPAAYKDDRPQTGGHMTLFHPRPKSETEPAVKALEAKGFKIGEAGPFAMRCAYCGLDKRRKAAVAHASGILGGHVECMHLAFWKNRLVLNWANALKRTDDMLNHSLSASNSLEVHKALRRKLRPIESFMDPREESPQRKVLVKGKDRWPNLAADDKAAMEEAKRSGEAKMTSQRHDLPGSPGYEDNVQALHELGARGTKRTLQARIAAHQVVGGQPFPSSSFDEWRTPHSSDGVDCYGKPGVDDVCDVPSCYYAGSSQTELTGVEAAAMHNHCLTFSPQRIGTVVMHERTRPSEGCVREMDVAGVNVPEVMEREWQKLADEKLKKLKLTKGHLPYCSEHEGRWGLKDNKDVHVSLKAVLAKMSNKKGEVLEWVRGLYLVCPGEPDGWERDPPAGFGG